MILQYQGLNISSYLTVGDYVLHRYNYDEYSNIEVICWEKDIKYTKYEKVNDFKAVIYDKGLTIFCLLCDKMPSLQEIYKKYKKPSLEVNYILYKAKERFPDVDFIENARKIYFIESVKGSKETDELKKLIDLHYFWTKNNRNFSKPRILYKKQKIISQDFDFLYEMFGTTKKELDFWKKDEIITVKEEYSLRKWEAIEVRYKIETLFNICYINALKEFLIPQLLNSSEKYISDRKAFEMSAIKLIFNKNYPIFFRKELKCSVLYIMASFRKDYFDGFLKLYEKEILNKL